MRGPPGTVVRPVRSPAGTSAGRPSRRSPRRSWLPVPRRRGRRIRDGAAAQEGTQADPQGLELSCDDGRVVGCVRRLCVGGRSDSAAVVVVRQRSCRWLRAPVVRLCEEWLRAPVVVGARGDSAVVVRRRSCRWLRSPVVCLREERRRRCRATAVASLGAFAGCASVRGATPSLSCDDGRVVGCVRRLCVGARSDSAVVVRQRPRRSAAAARPHSPRRPVVPAAPPGGLTAAQPRGRPHRPCATRPSASATARARGRRSAVRAGRRRRSGSPASA